MADIKNFLYAWLGKKKLTPSYDIRAAGNKNRQKFLCEVSCLACHILLPVALYCVNCTLLKSNFDILQQGSVHANIYYLLKRITEILLYIRL